MRLVHSAVSTPSSRVLIAANRLPVTATRRGGTVHFRPSVGGLATGLRQIARRWPLVWFGWHGLPTEADTRSTLCSGRRSDLVEIPLSWVEIEHFYRRYANCVLWPALHGWSDDIQSDATDWTIYQAVNQRYAATILSQLQHGDRVWIHDFHLLLVAKMIKAQANTVPLAFFLHTPFPPPEEFLRVPQARELVEGMLGANIVGFHTRSYASNFVETARRLGYACDGNEVFVGERAVTVTSQAMGIDFDEFSSLANDPRVLSEAARVQSTKAPMMMLGVDRLDYTKGIPERLIAFERLLERHPDLRKRVSLVQIAVPTREEICAYRDLREVVEQLVRRINDRFGTSGWQPVDYLFGTVDLHTLIALYRTTDVMLVTPHRDGLNLVAKEFVASRVDGNGVLLLSKFAGVADELTDALQVDPSRIPELSDGLYTALHMPTAERRWRMRRMRRTVQANSVFRWATAFISELAFLAEAAVV